MSRDVIIQIRLPRWSARRWLAIAMLAAVIGAGTVYAKVVWTPFAGGAKLTSKQLNDNFTAMADAIDAINAMMPAAVQLPHLVVDQGKVDLGIYLGTYAMGAGNNFGGAALFTFHPKAKAPLLVFSQMTSLLYDGANCTGTAYAGSFSGFGNAFNVWSNTAVNSDLGTIVQIAGPTQNGIAVRSQRSGGVCAAVNPYFTNSFPVVDTKVPNTPSVGEVSIQMM